MKPALLCIFFLQMIPFATPLKFNFTSFVPDYNITYEGDAIVTTNQTIQLTTTLSGKPVPESGGRATYHQPMQLWDKNSGQLAYFTTHFSFVMNSLNQTTYGDGLAFFLAPYHPLIPPNLTKGGALGLATNNPYVAVEFDISQNYYDPPHDHVGIDVNSRKSVTNETWWSDVTEGKLIDVRITYDNRTQNLSVLFTGFPPNGTVQQYLSYKIDLRLYLPDQVVVGLSASTGSAAAIHTVCSWDLGSSLELDDNTPPPSPPSPKKSEIPGFVWVIVAVVVLLVLFIIWQKRKKILKKIAHTTTNVNERTYHQSVASELDRTTVAETVPCNQSSEAMIGERNVSDQAQYKSAASKRETENRNSNAILEEENVSHQTHYQSATSHERETLAGSETNLELLRQFQLMDNEFQMVEGARKFSYNELANATNNFDDKTKKLGKGGCGVVYEGDLAVMGKVAVKKLFKVFPEVINNYAKEVKISSKLNHPNLIKLLGWCHENLELLLVFEYIPNGSLYDHLYERNPPLMWKDRFKIAKQLASALHYLHEECQECDYVLHRDIKSKNVMLDSENNAKLVDFGLARLVNLEGKSQQTLEGWSTGYTDPECFKTQKSNKKSDIYSFGVLILEIASGRKAPSAEVIDGYTLSLADWARQLFREGKLHEAVDQKLGREFNEQEMQLLLRVGVWCTKEEPGSRPSIKEAKAVLNSLAPLPDFLITICKSELL